MISRIIENRVLEVETRKTFHSEVVKDQDSVYLPKSSGCYFS